MEVILCSLFQGIYFSLDISSSPPPTSNLSSGYLSKYYQPWDIQPLGDDKVDRFRNRFTLSQGPPEKKSEEGQLAWLAAAFTAPAPTRFFSSITK